MPIYDITTRSSHTRIKGSDVQTVVIGGKVVMRDHLLLTVKEDEVFAKARQYGKTNRSVIEVHGDGHPYNQVAGRTERLAALSDGIFGVAMTLLLLQLHVPAKELIHSEGDLRHALLALAPQLLVYLMSFMTLGIFWVGQQTQLNHLVDSERHFTLDSTGVSFYSHDHAVFHEASD